MNKFPFFIIAFIYLAQLQAQFTGPGRYHIKLEKSKQAIRVNNGFLRANDACSDPRRNCENQLWDIIAILNSEGFLIQNVQTKEYLTFFEECSGCRGVSQQLKAMPLMSGAASDKQKFLVGSMYGANDFFVFPFLSTIQDIKDAEYFLAAGWEPRSILNANIIIDCKVHRCNPRYFENQDNITWNFTKIPVVVTARMPQPKPVESPPVVVSPNSIDIDIKTGSDNLEPKSTQHNAELRVILQNRADVIKLNINEGREWPNNSIKRITLPLPANITENEVKEIQIYRKRDGLTYVWQLGEKDNWNIDRVTVNVNLITNGVMKRTQLLETGVTRPRVPGNNNLTKPLFRFIYEGGDNISEGQFFKLVLSPTVAASSNSNTSSDASILAIFGIGGDDLRGGNDNVDIRILFKSNRTPITITNANRGFKWDNFTEQSYRKVLTNTQNLDFNDIKEIELRHTGGGGISADNWYLDKFKFSISNGIENRILVDRVASPIHFFTGESRVKRFPVQ
jgi:hypothetical protein